jgi:hypothetical protein
MSSRTFLSMQEKAAPHFEISMECYTLLSGGNESGGYNNKPLMMYHSNEPSSTQGLF